MIFISESKKKNIRMVVYHNVGPDGKKGSITRFEAIDTTKPVYRRFKAKGE